MTTERSNLPSLDEISRLPLDDDHDIVFREPWEARAFGIVVHLHQEGHFTWPDWADYIAKEIKAAGASDTGEDYYLYWLSAAEKILADSNVCDVEEVRARKADLEAAQNA
ncbi:MAG: nitrile hydratase accessory protein [Pseudomonadota bacterium]